MMTIDAQAAYRRGWKSCRYHDDSAEGFKQARMRFVRKYGEHLAVAWEQGWCDSASRDVS